MEHEHTIIEELEVGEDWRANQELIDDISVIISDVMDGELNIKEFVEELKKVVRRGDIYSEIFTSKLSEEQKETPKEEAERIKEENAKEEK